jgi:hypothetical protein
MCDERCPHNSFVLRIWWEANEGSPRVWRGRIQHAATGDVAYVQTLRDLRIFLEKWTGSLREVED